MNNQAEELIIEIYSNVKLAEMLKEEYHQELDGNTKKRIAWEHYKVLMHQRKLRKQYVMACDEEMSNDDLYTWLAGEQVKVDLPSTHG